MSNLNISLIHTSYPQHYTMIQTVLREFEAQHNIQIELDSLVWENARYQLVEYALHKTGPVISEVGSTWLSSLVSMNALLKLDSRSLERVTGSVALQGIDLAEMTDADIYLPTAWQSIVALDNQIWAIPWTTDTRMIYYRRDLLQKAGVDEATAFQSAAHWKNTLQQLQDAGGPFPILLNTVREPALLHKVASWVWAEGGHFMQKGGRQTRFSEPEAQAGFYNYFNTFAPYLSPAAQNISEDLCSEMFSQGKGAMIVTGQWVLSRDLLGAMLPEVRENLGVAMMPVPPYVGGSHLVVWQHGLEQIREGLKLIEALTSHSAQMRLVSHGRVLPSRKAILNDPLFTTEFGYEVISQSLQAGASFDASYMWGLIEDRLTMFVSDIWQRLFANPDLDLEGELNQRLGLLAQRLDKTLQSR